MLITQQSHEELCKILTSNKVGDKTRGGRLQSLRVLIDWCGASVEARLETAHTKISFKDGKDLNTFSARCGAFSSFLKSSHRFGNVLFMLPAYVSNLGGELGDIWGSSNVLQYCMSSISTV